MYRNQQYPASELTIMNITGASFSEPKPNHIFKYTLEDFKREDYFISKTETRCPVCSIICRYLVGHNHTYTCKFCHQEYIVEVYHERINYKERIAHEYPVRGQMMITYSFEDRVKYENYYISPPICETGSNNE